MSTNLLRATVRITLYVLLVGAFSAFMIATESDLSLRVVAAAVAFSLFTFFMPTLLQIRHGLPWFWMLVGNVAIGWTGVGWTVLMIIALHRVSHT